MNMLSPAAVVFHNRDVPAESDRPSPERQVSGNPNRTTWNHYVNVSGEVNAGIWASEVGSWRIEMGPGEEEFFFVVEGRCRLINTDGVAVEARAGQSLVIPARFKGTFEVIEAMRKHYMIVERKG